MMKRKTKTLLMAAFLGGTLSVSAQRLATHDASAANKGVAATPVDQQATSQTQDLYNLLYNNYGQQIMTCSMANPVWDYDIAQHVKTLTGQWPAIHCFDLMHLCYSPADWINYNDITPVKEWYQKGGCVALMWHWQVPTVFSGSSAGNVTYTSTASETAFSPANILKEGSWEHRLFYEDLYEAYTVIKQLQDAGIPVIWRPLHEAAGNAPKGGQAWFWWGKDGADVFRQLWRRMYDYFQERDIHNLIWVWTSCDADGDWFPGDSYVDIIGTDIYDKDIHAVKARYEELQSRYPSHMLALSECGKVPYITIQRQEGVLWAWAMPWYNADGTTWVTDAWWKDAVRNYASGIRTVSSSPADITPTATYTLDGRPANHATHGLRIVRMSDGTVRKAL